MTVGESVKDVVEEVMEEAYTMSSLSWLEGLVWLAKVMITFVS